MEIMEQKVGALDGKVIVKSEDDKIREELMDFLSVYMEAHGTTLMKKWIAWIEKQGNQNPEWSKEDEERMRRLRSFIRTNYVRGDADTYLEREKDLVLFKSLHPQNQWKPTEGQLECLGYAIEKAEKDYSPLTNNRIYLTLKSLLEQLKAL